MAIVLLLVVSSGLLAICNESVDTLQMNGFRVRRKGKPVAYRRRDECERVFSSAKKMMTAEHNRLAEDILQACERLKVWWDNGIVE